MMSLTRIAKRIGLILLAVAGSGLLAFFLAAVLAGQGFLGTCFEGSCGYMALFFVFPLAWLVLLGVALFWLWSIGRSARYPADQVR